MVAAHKYSAKRTTCAAGHSHPSKAEARRCDELALLEKAGLISNLQNQPRFDITIKGTKVCTYVADFGYLAGSDLVIEDVKGVLTPIYKLKKKLVEASYPGVKIVEVRS